MITALAVIEPQNEKFKVHNAKIRDLLNRIHLSLAFAQQMPGDGRIDRIDRITVSNGLYVCCDYEAHSKGHKTDS